MTIKRFLSPSILGAVVGICSAIFTMGFTRGRDVGEINALKDNMDKLSTEISELTSEMKNTREELVGVKTIVNGLLKRE